MKRSAFAASLFALLPVAALPAAAPRTVRLPDGLSYVDVRVGRGPTPKTGQTVTVNYVGKLTNGKVFDESAKHGGTFDFEIGTGHVIRGWDEGVATMRPGGRRRLVIPPSLGYGAQGAGGVIPPNATLVFLIDLIKIT